jgi:hypothetical protein
MTAVEAFRSVPQVMGEHADPGRGKGEYRQAADEKHDGEDGNLGTVEALGPLRQARRAGLRVSYRDRVVVLHC